MRFIRPSIPLSGGWSNRSYKACGQTLLIISIQVMGSVTSRLCDRSTPTFALSDVCQSLRCLVACCGSQVLIDLRDATEEYQKQTSNEEDEEEDEEQEPKESTFRETVL